MIDITTAAGIPVTTAAQAIVALLLTRYVDELCSDWHGPSGGIATA